MIGPFASGVGLVTALLLPAVAVAVTALAARHVSVPNEHTGVVDEATSNTEP